MYIARNNRNIICYLILFRTKSETVSTWGDTSILMSEASDVHGNISSFSEIRIKWGFSGIAAFITSTLDFERECMEFHRLN